MATTEEARAARDAKLDELHERLTGAVEQLVTGEDWKRALEFAARFRSRSFGNGLLIAVQHFAAYEAGRVPDPEPSYVAGYKQWQSLGRQVEKGQPGYMILAPVTGRFASSTPQDAESWRRLGRFEKPRPGEAVRSRMIGAKPAYVWDVSQTTGEPFPVPPRPHLLEGQAPDGLWEDLAGLVEADGYRVLRVEHEGLIHGANGLTDYGNRTVAVRTNMDPAAQTKTLAHELAHVRLHGPGSEDAVRHRGITEVEAESVALTLIWTVFIVFVFLTTRTVQRRVSMRVEIVGSADGREVRLLDAEGSPVAVVAGYLDYLGARGCSPNTVRGYAYDLLHLWRFLGDSGLGWVELRPRSSMQLLAFLRSEPSRSRGQRLSLSVVGPTGAPTLSASTVNRILTGIGGFYEWAIATEQFDGMNPIERRPDPAWRRVTDRHQPFTGEASRQRAQRRVLKVRQPRRLPRPLSDEQIDALFANLAGPRDRAILLLILNGGLRPGEALSLHLEDIAYGRRRVFVRVRDDHPGGVRPKSRSERVVDLFDADTLAAVSDYVMAVRPPEAASLFVFLVGGNGTRRCEPLSYAALARLFARAAARAGIREPWVTPHALRHTHATRMWEGGMRELTLQRRLGHASVESTRLYTRVSDHEVAADYLRALGQDGGERR